MKFNFFSLTKSTAHSRSGLLLIRLYVKLHLHYLGGKRKGKAPVVVERTPSRSLHGCLGLQGEAQEKKKAGERHCWSPGYCRHWCRFHMPWTSVFPPSSLGGRLAAANPFLLEASPLERCTSLMVSNEQGTCCLCHFGKTLLPLHGTNLQMTCEKTAVAESSLKQLEDGSRKGLEEMSLHSFKIKISWFTNT